MARKAKAAPSRSVDLKARLAPLRNGIDGIDNEIIDLLNRRARLAQEIGHLKAQASQPAYVPERERQVLARLVARSQGPLGEESLRLIYKEIISASLALESPLKVAYLGPEATLGHAAGKRHFGLSAQLSPCASLAEVFSEVERGQCDYGLVPIETTGDGIVHQTLDMFVGSDDITICAEVLLRFNHQLLTRTGNLRGVDKIFAHPETIEPCRAWLQTHLPGIPVVHAGSTPQAAHMAQEGNAAVLATSNMAASLYGLQVAASNLEDTGGNFSRFLVIGHDVPTPSGHDRTSLIFAIQRDAPGMLYEALQAFARTKVNMTRIESRPSRRRDWDYLFFVDLDGHQSIEPLHEAIALLATRCVFLKVLGSYPQGKMASRRASAGVGPVKES